MKILKILRTIGQKFLLQAYQLVFFCKDYLVDGILSDFVQICNQKGIETDILFQNYHRGRISEEDVTEELMLIKAPSRPAKSGRLYIPAHAVRRGLRGPFLGTFLWNIPIISGGKQKGTN